jgi:hypothetical protein
MFIDWFQTIISHQQSTKKVHQRSVKRPSTIVRAAMVVSQSDGDAVTT